MLMNAAETPCDAAVVAGARVKNKTMMAFPSHRIGDVALQIRTSDALV
jgi:hypothetical protein